MAPKLERIEIDHSPWVGVFSSVNDEIALLPANASSRICRIYEEVLDVETKKTTICSTSIVGSLTVMNSKGIVAPIFTSSDEKKILGSLGLNVGYIRGGPNAAGNIVLATDDRGLVPSTITDETKEMIQDVMDVELLVVSIPNMEVLGSAGVISSEGLIISPKVMDSELETIGDFLRLKVELGTVNGGSEYVGAGTVVNSKGAVIGKATTGMEMGRLEEVLFSRDD